VTIIHGGMQSVWRQIVGLALVPWLAVSGLVPPEHVHEPDADHPHAVAHRHFAAHDHDATEVSPGEGRVVWFDTVAVEHARFPTTVAIALLPATFEAVPPTASTMVALTVDAAPPHGPPRSTLSLRAPPPSRLA
jgi:hypothetical protein